MLRAILQGTMNREQGCIQSWCGAILPSEAPWKAPFSPISKRSLACAGAIRCAAWRSSAPFCGETSIRNAAMRTSWWSLSPFRLRRGCGTILACARSLPPCYPVPWIWSRTARFEIRMFSRASPSKNKFFMQRDAKAYLFSRPPALKTHGG